MPCKVDLPSATTKEWLEHMLCKACRFLTQEQINSINGLDGYIGLSEWYKHHLMEDFSYFNEIKDIKEYHDAPFSFSIFLFENEVSELKSLENKRITHEAEKMGWNINKYGEDGIECK